jgi:hypothetical protein
MSAANEPKLPLWGTRGGDESDNLTRSVQRKAAGSKLVLAALGAAWLA